MPTPEARGDNIEINSFEDMAIRIQDLIGAFVPPEGEHVTWLDVRGVQHEASVLLGARQQFKLAKWVQDNWSLVRAWVNDNDKISVAQLIASIDTEDTLDRLVEAFMIVHPDHCKPPSTPDGHHIQPSAAWAADEYPMEEMVKAILPFCARPLDELANMTLDAVRGLVGSRPR